MALRTFTDSEGREWEVWAVVPRALEGEGLDRRRTERRAGELSQAEFDRRRTDRRTGLSPGMADGWLAFRCRQERRRLAPIPDGWVDAATTQLEIYCRGARVVGAAPMHFVARAGTPPDRE